MFWEPAAARSKNTQHQQTATSHSSNCDRQQTIKYHTGTSVTGTARASVATDNNSTSNISSHNDMSSIISCNRCLNENSPRSANAPHSVATWNRFAFVATRIPWTPAQLRNWCPADAGCRSSLIYRQFLMSETFLAFCAVGLVTAAIDLALWALGQCTASCSIVVQRKPHHQSFDADSFISW